ncbi:hypothetical protein ACH3XW_44440 [Acanthocheilonema viteae]
MTSATNAEIRKQNNAVNSLETMESVDQSIENHNGEETKFPEYIISVNLMMIHTMIVHIFHVDDTMLILNRMKFQT